MKKWFKNLFGDLVDIAKKILGIASPSKVFAQLGRWSAEGFGIGFDDEFADVANDIGNSLDFGGYDYEVSYDGEKARTVGSLQNTSGITIIQNIQAVPQTPVELAAATEAYFEQARWAFA
jgi:hypothetical protein